MKGKNTLSKIIAICLATALSLSLLSGIGSFASAASMKESTYVNKTIDIATGVRINITTYDKDNKESTKQFIPTDINGNTVYPFITNGTTYLPVRAVSNIFGASIEWNTFYSSVVIATSKTARVTNTNPKAVDNSSVTAKYSTVNAVSGVNIYVDNAEFIPTDVNGNRVDVLLINGTTYLPVRAMTTIFAASINWDPVNYTATIVGAKGTSSGDTEDITDGDLSSIISKLFGNLFSKDKIISMLNDMLAIRLKAEDAFGISDMKNVINKMIDNMSADQMIKLIKAYADAKNTTIEKLMELFKVDNSKDLIAKFKEALKAYVEKMELPELKAFLESLKNKFGINFDLEEIFGKISIDPNEFLAYIKSMLPSNININTLAEKVQAKIAEGKTSVDAIKAALGEMIPDISNSKIQELINGWLTQNPQFKLADLLNAFGSSDTSSLISLVKTKLGTLISSSPSTGLQSFMDLISGKINQGDGSGSAISTKIDAAAIGSMLQSIMGQFSGSFDSSDILSSINSWASSNGYSLADIQKYFNVSDNSSLISSAISSIQSSIPNSGSPDFFSTINGMIGSKFGSLSDMFNNFSIG